MTLVLVSLHLSISIESVGYDGAAFLDALDDKAVQGLARGIWNASQAYAPNALAVLLSGDRDQAFAVCKPPGCSTGFFCTPISFIHFDNPGQTVSSGAHHRTAQLMQKAPRRFVASQSPGIQRCRPRALMPFFWLATCHIARNHVVNGSLLS